jgi:hypothetical protein
VLADLVALERFRLRGESPRQLVDCAFGAVLLQQVSRLIDSFSTGFPFDIFRQFAC